MVRRNFADGMEITYEDLNKITSSIEKGVLDRVIHKMLLDVKDAFFGESFLVTRTSSTAVSVAAGLGIQEDNSVVSPEPTKRLLYLSTSTGLNITTPDPSNPRIDLVCVKASRATTATATRKYKDPSTSAITSETMDVETDWDPLLTVVAGTPAGSPSAPSVPSGYIKICTITVDASTGITNSGNLADNRTLMPIAENIFYDTTAFSKLTSGSTTKFSTLFSDIDTLLKTYNKNVHAVSSANYTLTDTDGYRTVNVTTGASDRTITLPTADDNEGRVVTIVKADSGSGNVIIDGEGSETISGLLTISLVQQNEAVTLLCDNGNWHIVGDSFRPTKKVVTVSSADYAVLDNDRARTILVTTGGTDRTITLPASANNLDRIITIKKIDSGAGKVTVDGNSSETIDGATTLDLFLQYDQITVQCDGSNWHIIHKYLAPQIVSADADGTQTVSDNAAITFIFGDETIDSHSAYDASTGVFTAKRAGKFLVKAAWSPGTSETWTNVIHIVSKNSGATGRGGYISGGPSQYNSAGTGLFDIVELSAGDTLSIRGQLNTDGSGDITIIGSLSSGAFSAINSHLQIIELL